MKVKVTSSTTDEPVQLEPVKSIIIETNGVGDTWVYYTYELGPMSGNILRPGDRIDIGENDDQE